ncbi:hypothetical protein MKW94_000405 [Papaver nudicaule]|uniref:Uncharacterized protein n=1 Tax=Papaver nudicaule TaxID=74823 RepID=A0AA41S2S6_PAPNU|nr:hypothetical protein [Papaver nudicaule]MCL7031884.1 hypothetical protein [Papaver nudicaule]
MGGFSKKQLVSSFTTMHIVIALVICLVILGGFSYSVEASAGRINDGKVAIGKVIESLDHGTCTTVIEGRCQDHQECTTLCRSKKYSGGKCLPNDIDKESIGICCCLN